MPRVQRLAPPSTRGVADPGRCEGPRGRVRHLHSRSVGARGSGGFHDRRCCRGGHDGYAASVLAVVVTLATAGVVWWMFRPKAGKVVICEKCGARYAVVQPPKYTNGWNYDKIAPASGRELPEGEPASDEGSQAPAPASAPSAANSKES
ncbi:MAG: hypothetical protein ACLTDR_00565 [Adlercreutzia equolifaciens]